jgi:hypothetical protein
MEGALSAADFPRALRILKSLSRVGGPVGENALYQTGLVLRDRMGQPGRALRAWRQYARRYPRGLLRSEVSLSVMETLAEAGRLDAAITEAENFLERFPKSERAHEVRRSVESWQKRAEQIP